MPELTDAEVFGRELSDAEVFGQLSDSDVGVKPKTPKTVTFGGREIPVPDQSNNPPVPREVTDIAGLPPQQTRTQSFFQSVPPVREIVSDTIEPFMVPISKLASEEIQRPLSGGKTLTESAQSLFGKTGGQVASGLTKVGLAQGETLTSPLFLAGPAAGALSSVWQRLVSAGFSADMLSQVPAQWNEVKKAFSGGDLEDKITSVGDLIFNLTFAGL